MIQFQNRQIQLPDGAPVIVSRILGSIDGSTVRQFEEKLLGFLGQGVQHLIIVFSQVNYINSTGMGVLVKIADKFQESGGDISLVDVPDKLIALFNMLGLLSLIKLSKSEEEAVQTFYKNRSQSGGSVPPQANIAPKPQEPPAHHQPRRTVSKPSAPKSSAVKTRARSNSKRKTYIIRCQSCSSKINLGARPKVGTYRCPRCMVVFKLQKNGKIHFQK
ncbi:STAS domain-containing protein [Candidatus Uabimicrobium amorphum]|uniref:Anti-sigma factor antagonist n=1 Tax=Uabimicrobium amorphum TaxID=2596890 RepID=A0A5S9IQI9_UABAM|nr:STAS domain-containing protein [Candidatus Uabimicrobium amorphum]BBM85612.1 anti-sigma factor antagonist [Candidatus Uabimicrobium amorphum]